MSRRGHRPADVGLLALDVDGTLLDWDGWLPPATAQAVTQAINTPGLNVVLATGRSIHSTMGVAARLGLTEGWAVCANGSVTIRLDPARPSGWELVEAITFDPRPALDVIHRLVPEAALAVEELGVGFLVTAYFPRGELDGQLRVVSYEELAARPATRVILRETEMHPDRLGEIVRATRLPGVTYAVGHSGWVDLNPPGVSKASALEVLRQQLGVPASGTVALGDGGNDVSMLAWASRGVAMGRSREDVVAAASEVTGNIEDGGAADLIFSVLAELQ
ncbi:MAG: HAD family hydrolase [Bifidobacteriaceae bacterium]|nr:HAD family hydrolase [Bifidobacteriaceae bacterium]